MSAGHRCLVPLATLVLLGSLIASSAGTASADLTGRWRLELAPALSDAFVDITQQGNSVSFSLANGSFNGTRIGALLEATATGGKRCTMVIKAMASPDDSLLTGALGVGASCPGGPDIVPLRGHRCGCSDRNAVNGDGCSAECRVEPCFTCSGDPSVCVPASDGEPCDDGRDCTDGETCTGRICRSRSPVTPCVDLSGQWLLHFDFSPSGQVFDRTVQITQANNFVEVRGDARTDPVELAGTIDPATGVFQLLGTALTEDDYFCPVNTFDGQAPIGANTLTGNFTALVFSTFPQMCTSFVAAVSGARCGGNVDCRSPCTCDCDGNGTVGIGELVRVVNIVLEKAPVSSCSALPSDREIRISDVVNCVTNTLQGCPNGP